jgi:hypothetical protein
MGVESRLLGPQPVPPPAAAGNPAAGASPASYPPGRAPGAQKVLAPGQPGSRGVRLTANQSPTAPPEQKPTPPADHHGSSPGRGGGATAPAPTVTVTRPTPSSVLPAPSPSATCVVRVLNIGVVCVKG